MTYPGVVSLYSFKGGAGRTVCTANLAGLLARRVGASPANPLLLIDMDLDSAGLTILLRQYERFVQGPYSISRILTGDVNLGVKRTRETLLRQGLVDVSDQIGVASSSALFLGAQPAERDFPEDLRGIAEQNMLRFLRLSHQERGIRTVVIDSASGLQDSAMLCHRVSDVIVYCCRLTLQFLFGTGKQLKHFMSECRTPDQSPHIILLPVAVPSVTERWGERYRACLGELQGLVLDLQKQVGPQIELFREIREVDSFKWIESILVSRTELATDEEAALEAFGSLAGRIGELLDARGDRGAAAARH